MLFIIKNMYNYIITNYGHYIYGLLFITILADILIFNTVEILWKCIGFDRKPEDISWQSHILGCLERILYVFSFRLGKLEFIGIWLALKVGGQWKSWSEDQEINGRKISGRAIYNIFLIGNALSVLYGIIGAKSIDWCLQGNSFVITVPAVLVLLTLFIGCWTKHWRQRE